MKPFAAFLGIAFAVGLVAPASPARAHDLPLSSIDIEASDDVLLARITGHAIDFANRLGPAAPEDSLIDRDFLPRQAGPLFEIVRERVRIAADGAPLAPSLEGLIAHPEELAITIVVRYPLASPAKTLAIEGWLFDDPRHLTLIDVREDGETVAEDFFNFDRRSMRIRMGSAREVWPTVRRFVESGIHHIFIGPDHILFLVALVLAGGGIGRLLKIVTGFTIGHSVTLSLATLGVLDPPGTLVEPLIALSIVVVGLENIRMKPQGRDPRAFLAFAFGFVHGFGFASVLRDFGIPPKSVGWALFSFNAGVEIGQICIVGAVAPVLALVRAKAPRASRFVLIGGSVFVACAGAWWFVERVFLGG